MFHIVTEGGDTGTEILDEQDNVETVNYYGETYPDDDQWNADEQEPDETNPPVSGVINNLCSCLLCLLGYSAY